jgi:hypothetical protein
MPAPKFKLLDNKIDKAEGDQSVVLTSIMTLGKNKLRFYIRSNAYQAQCSAVVSVWRADHLDWSRVAGLVPETMKTPKGLIYHPGTQGLEERHFYEDVKELQRQALLILA